MGQMELHMVTVFSVIIASVTGANKSLHLGRRVQHALKTFTNCHKVSWGLARFQQDKKNFGVTCPFPQTLCF